MGRRTYVRCNSASSVDLRKSITTFCKILTVYFYFGYVYIYEVIKHNGLCRFHGNVSSGDLLLRMLICRSDWVSVVISLLSSRDLNKEFKTV